MLESQTDNKAFVCLFDVSCPEPLKNIKYISRQGDVTLAGTLGNPGYARYIYRPVAGIGKRSLM